MAMNLFPIFSGGAFPEALQFIPAVIIGFFFGFVLERSGFGNARILAAQFYLHNMRVFKVMFGAIVTAATGLALASATGLLDMSAMFIPETFAWPHLVGGLLLGAGFIISGYCPGTAIVAAASAKWDALFTLAGVVIGSVVFGELYGLIGDFHVSSALGVFTVPDWLGIGMPFLVAGLALMAVGAFFGAEFVEKIFSARGAKVKEDSMSPLGKSLLGGLAGAAMLGALLFAVLPAPARTSPTPSFGTISVVEVARMVVEEPRSLYLIDARDDAVCQNSDRLPYAICLADIVADLPDLKPRRILVVYGAEGLADAALPQELARYSGPVSVAAEGYVGWQELIVATQPDTSLLASLAPADRELVGALHAYFTGTQVAAQPAAPRPKVKRKLKKSGGCS
jgi:hypothetical protein